MSDKPWKKNERDIAKFVGGERVPITGRQRGDAPDIKHPWLAIEVKLRGRLPTWLKEGMNQAEESKIGNQMPVMILREKHQRIEDAIICVRLKDFRDRYL